MTQPCAEVVDSARRVVPDYCELEIAWAAGLFEGEGWAFTRPQPQNQGNLPMVVVGLGSTDPDVVERFGAVLGVGRTVKPHTRSVPAHWKPLYRWMVRDWPGASVALATMRPYLGTRRGGRADEILAIWRDRKHLYGKRRRRGDDPALQYVNP